LFSLDESTLTQAYGMAREAFQEVKNGYGGQDVVIDGISKRAIIVDKYHNPDNDMLKILDEVDSFKVGSIVEFQNKNWIVLATDANNPIYLLGIMRCCSADLKWDNFVHPCIVATKNLTVNYSQYVLLPEGTINVTAQLNDETKTIKLNQRFIFGSSAFYVTGIDDFTIPELLQLTLKVTLIDDNDNLVEDIANNSPPNKGGKWL
jgi:hypothetical protein